MKTLQVESHGYVWEIPAEIIALNRTSYYEGRGSAEEDEYETSMQADELYDWFVNNIDWKNVAKYSTLIETPVPLTKPDPDNWSAKVVENGL